MCNNYYFSQPIADLFGGIRGGFNLQWNASMMDLQARSWTGWVPQFNWNGINQYSVPSGGLNFFLDPNYAAYQTMQCMPGGSIFGGGFPQTPTWPWMTPGGNNGSTPKTEAEILAEEKYKQLEKLVNELVKDGSGLTAPDRASLKAAKSNAKGSYAEKLETLQDAFNKLMNDTQSLQRIKNAILEGKIGLDVNGTQLAELLNSTGIKTTTNKTQIDEIKTAIEAIDGKANPEGFSSGAIGNVQIGELDILDLVSAYDTVHNGSNDKLMYALCGKIKDNDQTNIINARNTLINALIDKANGLKDILGTGKTEIETAITELQAAKNAEFDSDRQHDIADKFYNLYALTRAAATLNLNTELQKAYGGVADKVFTSDLFNKKNEDDLATENCTAVEVTLSEEERQNVKDNAKPIAEDVGGEQTTRVTAKSAETLRNELANADFENNKEQIYSNLEAFYSNGDNPELFNDELLATENAAKIIKVIVDKAKEKGISTITYDGTTISVENITKDMDNAQLLLDAYLKTLIIEIKAKK